MSQPSASKAKSAPRNRIRLRGPLVAGMCAIAAFAAVAVGAVEYGPALGGYHIKDATLAVRRIQPVVHPGGKIAAVYAEAGKAVAAGDILATIEAGDLDGRIAALKVQSDAAQLQLQAVRREAQAFTTLLQQRLVSRQRVVELERQVADLEREAAAVLARAEAAQYELGHTEIRAPVSGILQVTGSLVPGRFMAPGEIIAEIAPSTDMIVLEARLSPAEAKAAQKTGNVRLWMGVASWFDARPVSAKLTWLSPPAADGKPQTAHFELQRSALPNAGAAHAAGHQRTTLSIRSVDKSLLQTLLEPFRRSAANGAAA